jgi:hypothetical protein
MDGAARTISLDQAVLVPECASNGLSRCSLDAQGNRHLGGRQHLGVSAADSDSDLAGVGSGRCGRQQRVPLKASRIGGGPRNRLCYQWRHRLVSLWRYGKVASRPSVKLHGGAVVDRARLGAGAHNSRQMREWSVSTGRWEPSEPRWRARTVWARDRSAPLRAFLVTESGSAVLLVAGIAVALLWANVHDKSYESFWGTPLSIQLGGAGISLDLREWVNRGLMTFFFLVVGLEARREFDLGDLRERRRFVLPFVAGLAGMAVPIGIYLAINAGRSSAHGWGVAMSTDTALALGLLALLGQDIPDRMRVFVLTIFVVDDLVALAVIAIVYSDDISLASLLPGLVAFRPSAGRRPAAPATTACVRLSWRGAVDRVVEQRHRSGCRRPGDRAGGTGVRANPERPATGHRAGPQVP